MIKKIFINLINTILYILSNNILLLVFKMFLNKDFYHLHKWKYSYDMRDVSISGSHNRTLSTIIKTRFYIRICEKCHKKQKKMHSYIDNNWESDSEYTIEEKREIAFKKLNIK